MAGTDTEAQGAEHPSRSARHRDDVRLLRQHVLLELARREKTDLTATFHAVTEAAAAVMEVARASIWRLEQGRGLLTCQDLFVAEHAEHLRGARLSAADAPHYFAALLEARAIPASDARKDPRTAEFLEGYLEPLGIGSMLDVPIWSRGHLYGVLCVEHVGPPRSWSPGEVDFAGNLADVVALALSSAEHARSERRWEAVVNAMSECVIVVGRNNEVLMMNPAARATFVRADSDLVTLAERQQGLEFYSLAGQLLPPERWPGARALRGEYVRGEMAEVHIRATGERRLFRMTTAPLCDGEAVSGGVLVLADVTDELHFERLKRDFLAELAHELRTPVAITKLSAQHVAGAPDLPPSLRPRLEAIGRAGLRMERLVDDIVEVSSIMLGDLVLERRPVELGGLVRSLVAALPREGRRRVKVEAPEPLHVLADPARLGHALRHLVDNALRYAPTGYVQVSVRPAQHGAEVCVQDEGIGIPEDKQPHLFELFFRAHAGTPHDVGGMGIGLFLCHELLRLHGGSMRVQSTEGVGSTFCAWLPLTDVH